MEELIKIQVSVYDILVSVCVSLIRITVCDILKGYIYFSPKINWYQHAPVGVFYYNICVC